MNNIVTQIHQCLKNYYPYPEVRNLSRWICCEIFGQSSVDYYLDKDIVLSGKDRLILEDILLRLCKFEPIQYIQGVGRFCGCSFNVARGVLVPRPETEELVELMQREIKPNSRILDVGTGSGCIAITLAKNLPDSDVTAWDISADALAIAKSNSDKFQVRIKFEQHDILNGFPVSDKLYDVIVSNPPYVMDKEANSMEPNVLNWEPREALFVPDNDPLLFYRKISIMALTQLKEGGLLYFEINREFGLHISEMLTAMGFHNVRLLKDISGNNRFIVAVR